MSTAVTAPNATGHQSSDDQVALPLRGDTFLGVCEAIGQDVGINPNWLRIAFAPFIIVNPLATIGVYLALGVVVAASRWFFPAVKRAGPAGAAEQHQEEIEERLAA